MVSFRPTVGALLATMAVDDVWGVGSRLAARLRSLGIANALALKRADPKHICGGFNVVLERTVTELRGTPCIALEEACPYPVRDFVRFTAIARPEEFPTVTRAHVIAWRDELVSRGLAGSTIRHRLASLASLFQHLCNENAVTHNPVKGVQRPTAEAAEGKTPALGDRQARKLLDAPIDEGVRGRHKDASRRLRPREPGRRGGSS